jgi:hypothetical protein
LIELGRLMMPIRMPGSVDGSGGPVGLGDGRAEALCVSVVAVGDAMAARVGEALAPPLAVAVAAGWPGPADAGVSGRIANVPRSVSSAASAVTIARSRRSTDSNSPSDPQVAPC